MRGISSHHDFHNHRLRLGKSEIATPQASPILFLSWRCCSNRAGTRATQKRTNCNHCTTLKKRFHSKPCPPEWWILAMASPPLLEPETLMANDHRWLRVQPNGSTSFNIKFPKSSCKTHLWRYFWDLWVSFKRQLLLGTPACLEHCSLNLGNLFIGKPDSTLEVSNSLNRTQTRDLFHELNKSENAACTAKAVHCRERFAAR